MTVPEFDPTATIPTILEIVQRQFGGDAPQLVMADTFNHVFTQPAADMPYTLKVPSLESALPAAVTAARAAVGHESAALGVVNHFATTCPLALPKLLATGEADGRPYLVASFVPGDHLSMQDTIDDSCARDIGRSAAEAGLWMAAIPPETMEGAPKGEEPDWDKFLNFDFHDPCFPSLSALAAEMKALFKVNYPDGITAAATHLIHGDLRIDNLVFRQNHVAGIIDFGSMRRGDFVQEMRGLHRLGQAALDGCNEVLASNGRAELGMEQLEMWPVGRAVNGLIRMIKGVIGLRTFADCHSYLVQCRPDKNWQELDQLHRGIDPS